MAFTKQSGCGSCKKNKAWKEGSVPTMFTTLYMINIKTEEQRQISFPKQNERDEDPQVISLYLTWLQESKCI